MVVASHQYPVRGSNDGATVTLRTHELGLQGFDWKSEVVTASLRCELFPGDLDAAVGFYVDVLGFTRDRDERASSSPYVALTHGTVQLGLAQRQGVVGAESRRPPAGVELVLEVDDLAAARDRVAVAGWPIDEDLTERPWGLIDFRVQDPAGYYWRITSCASG